MSTVDPTLPGSPPADDPFRYGWKEVEVTLDNGEKDYINIPLTLEECVHPEENYKIVNGSRHEEERYYIWGVVRHRLSGDPHALALSDTGVYWDDPELKHHSPDIVVFFGIPEPRDQWPSFFVAEEGVRPNLIIELTSPHNRPNDIVTKFQQYHQARVPWYLIVDRIQSEGPPCLLGYRWQPNGYVEFPPDADGRLLLVPIGLKLGVRGDRVALFDPKTGEELGDYDAVCRQVEKERAARLAAEEKARKAEEESQKAQDDARKAEAGARKAQDDARKAEEESRKAQDDARKAREAARAAEEKATAQAEALRAALEQIRLLQAQRPEGGTPST
jgi:Uma2 family endonuclease